MRTSEFVSILVLMDLSFLLENGGITYESKCSFNPCSYGSFVLTRR